MKRHSRPVYIVLRFGEALWSATSRFVNATVFGGSVYQSVSARAYDQGRDDLVWAKRRKLIDKVVFWEDAHCFRAWTLELENASKTIERNRAFPV